MHVPLELFALNMSFISFKHVHIFIYIILYVLCIVMYSVDY